MGTTGGSRRGWIGLVAGLALLVVVVVLVGSNLGRPPASPAPSESASPSAQSASPSPSAAPSISPSPSPSASPPGLPAIGLDSRISGASPFASCPSIGQFKNYPNSEVEPYVAVNPRDPANIVAVWQQDRWADGAARGIVTAASHDGGRTWRTTWASFSTCSGALAGPSSLPRASDPWVAFGGNGLAYQTALAVDNQRDRSAVLVSRSTNGGDTWSNPVAVIQNAGTSFNDKESIATDPQSPEAVYVVWDRTTRSEEAGAAGAQPAAGQVMLAQSTDGGVTWAAARVIAQVAGVPVGNVLVVLPDGTFLDVFQLVVTDAKGQRQLTESLIRSDDRGATWSSPQTIARVVGRDLTNPTTGNPIRVGYALPSVAVDPKDRKVAVVWADARFSRAGLVSVNVSLSANGGRTWTAPARVPAGGADRIAFTPSVAIDRDGTLAVSYYVLQPATGGRLLTDRFAAFSRDGAKWREVRLTPKSFDLRSAPNSFGLFLGDYTGLATADHVFVAVFPVTNATRGDPTTIVVRTSRAIP
jgi:hypothetical protein